MGKETQSTGSARQPSMDRIPPAVDMTQDELVERTRLYVAFGRAAWDAGECARKHGHDAPETIAAREATTVAREAFGAYCDALRAKAAVEVSS